MRAIFTICVHESPPGLRLFEKLATPLISIIIVSTAGAQVETTRAIEVNPDDYIKTRLYGLRGPALHFSVSYAKRIRSVQEKVWGFIDNFEYLNAVSNKI